MAPAMAPTGPSTSAPDKAPSAASPVRSCAIAAEDISAKEIVTIAIVFFIQDPRMGAPPMFPHCTARCDLRCSYGRVFAATQRRGENIARLIKPRGRLFFAEFELLVQPVAQAFAQLEEPAGSGDEQGDGFFAPATMSLRARPSREP